MSILFDDTLLNLGEDEHGSMELLQQDGPDGLALEHRIQTASKALLKHIRSVTNPPKKRGLFLRDFSDRQLLEIYFRMKAGQSDTKIGELIQKRWGRCTGKPAESMRIGLLTFRKRALSPLDQIPETPDTEEDRQAARIAKKAVKIRGAFLKKELDILGRMRWTIEQLTQRCLRWENMEADRDIMYEQASKDWRLLVEACEKMAKLELELGVLERVPSQVQVDWRGKLDCILQGRSDGGESLVSAMNTFMQKADAMTKTLVYDKERQCYDLEPTTEGDRVRRIALGLSSGSHIRPEEGSDGDGCESSAQFGEFLAGGDNQE